MPKLSHSLISAVLFACNVFALVQAQQTNEPDSALRIFLAAQQDIIGINADYTYKFKLSDSFGDYLRASSVLSQLRKGKSSPVVDEGKIAAALTRYAVEYKCQQKTDGRRYSMVVKKQLRGKDEISAHLYNGEKYYVQSRPGVRWDILPYNTLRVVSLMDILRKPIFTADPVPDSIIFEKANYAELLKEAKPDTLQVIKQSNDRYRIRFMNSRPIELSAGTFSDIYEIDVQLSSSVGVNSVTSYRVKKDEAKNITSNSLLPSQKTEAFFSEHRDIAPGVSIPFKVRIPISVSLAAVRGKIKAEEKVILGRMLPNSDPEKATLLCEHLFFVEKVVHTKALSNADFKPLLNSNSVVYSHITRKFENPEN